MMSLKERYEFRIDFRGWDASSLHGRIYRAEMRLSSLRQEPNTRIVRYLVRGYLDQLRRLHEELNGLVRPTNVGRRRNQPLMLTKRAGETDLRLTKKAPIWMVVQKNGTKCYGKVFGFVEKRGVSAQDRARAYAQKLADRSPGKRVYVLRPRVHFTKQPASVARLVAVEF